MSETDSASPRRLMKRAAIGATAAALVVLAAWTLWSRRTNEGTMPTDVPTFTVRSGPLTIGVSESGTIQARERILIKNELEGRTTILKLVPEGTLVAKGDLLVELDATTLQEQRLDQQIQVINAQALLIKAQEDLAVTRSQADSDIKKAELDKTFAEQDLKNYIEGEYPQQVKEVEAKISLAQEELRRAQEKLGWSKVLSGEKYLSQTELEADELAARKATLDLELAQSELALLSGFTHKRKLDELESAVSQTATALERVRRKAAADVVQAEATLKARKSENDREANALIKIEQELAKAVIRAPAAGMVIYATSAERDWHGNSEPLSEGQEVRQFENLIYLPTASSFTAQVKVHESAVDKVAVGQPARITVDALPGRVFSGKVSRIAPLPDPQSAFMNPDLKIFQTDIAIEEESADLRSGMSCRAEILVERYEDAVQVPVQAVMKVEGKPTVYVFEKGAWAPRSVEVGLDNNRMIRVEAGLSPGETVLLAPPLSAAETPPTTAAETRPTAAAETQPTAGMGEGGTGGPSGAGRPSDRPERSGADRGGGMGQRPGTTRGGN